MYGFFKKLMAMEEARQMDENAGPADSISVGVSRQTEGSKGSSLQSRASSECLKEASIGGAGVSPKS